MIRLGAAALFLSLAAMTQPLTFDVASVKATQGPTGAMGGCHGVDTAAAKLHQEGTPPLGRCVITGARLAHMVNIAWQINGMQLIQSTGDWIQTGSERFDVVAEAEDPAHTTEQQLLTMLQNLLIERFQMKFHREPVKTDGASLTVDKSGSKLVESTSDEVSASFGSKGKPTAADSGGGGGKPEGGGGGGKHAEAQLPASRSGTSGEITVKRYSIAMLASALSTFGGMGPVVDDTGLKGVYDFKLSWNEDSGPTLAKALQQQLGLHLSQEKVTVTNFVIDSAQRPSAN